MKKYIYATAHTVGGGFKPVVIDTEKSKAKYEIYNYQEIIEYDVVKWFYKKDIIVESDNLLDVIKCGDLILVGQGSYDCLIAVTKIDNVNNLVGNDSKMISLDKILALWKFDQYYNYINVYKK